MTQPHQSGDEDSLRILHLEDRVEDADLIGVELKRAGLCAQIDVAPRKEVFVQMLAQSKYDVVLGDYRLTDWTGLEAARYLHESGFDIPFILVTGTLGDELAAECMKQGIADYVLKDHLARLPIAIRRALEDQRVKNEAARSDRAVRESEERFRLIVEGSRDGFFYTHDEKSLFNYLSPSVEKILGYAPVELIGQPYEMLLDPEADNEEGKRLTNAALSSGVRQPSYHVIVRHKEGHRVVLEITESPRGGGQGATSMQGFARDITEKVRLEQQNLLLTSSIQAVANGVVITDPAGIILWTNPAFTWITGWEATEVVGKKTNVLKSGVHPPEFYREMWATIASGKVWAAELVNSKKDGSQYHEHMTITPVLDGAGHVTHYVGIKKDITEQKKEELQLLRRNSHYAVLAGVNQAIVTEATQEGLLQAVCRVCVQAGGFRFAWAGLLAENRQTIVPTCWSGHEDGFLKTLAADIKDSIGTKVVTQDFCIISSIEKDPLSKNWRDEALARGYRSAAIIPLKMSNSIIGEISLYSDKENSFDENDVRFFADLSLDVSQALGLLEQEQIRQTIEEALSQSQRMLQQILDTIPLRVFWKDRDCVFRGCNWAFARDAGLASPSEVIGKTYEELFPQEMARQFRAGDKEIMASGQPRLAIEEQRPINTGALRTLRTYKIPLRDSTGSVSGILGVYDDITDTKRLQEQFLQAQKMEAVGRLAGGVAHDFNNLLGVILGYANLLLDKGPNESLEEIRTAAERGAALTRQLLAFSRKEAVVLRAVNVNEVVAGTERLLHRLLGEDVTLETELEPGLWPILADPGYLEQILINLAVNARDAMAQGGKLRIATENRQNSAAATPGSAPGNSVLLKISDTGTGIDPEILEHIFEPFFTTKEKGKGTGLGLATVYGIAEQLGGKIQVHSAVGLGATFEISFPAADQSFTQDTQTTPAEETAEERRGGTILVVEDQMPLRRLARQVLESRGYSVLEAENGAAALELSGHYAGPIDALLTDVVMPEMSGRELVEKLLIQRPQTKVLFMSGYTDDTVLQHGIIARQVNFIEKPFSPKDLLGKLNDLLRGKDGAQSP